MGVGTWVRIHKPKKQRKTDWSVNLQNIGNTLRKTNSATPVYQSHVPKFQTKTLVKSMQPAHCFFTKRGSRVEHKPIVEYATGT